MCYYCEKQSPQTLLTDDFNFEKDYVCSYCIYNKYYEIVERTPFINYRYDGSYKYLIKLKHGPKKIQYIAPEHLYEITENASINYRKSPLKICESGWELCILCGNSHHYENIINPCCDDIILFYIKNTCNLCFLYDKSRDFNNAYKIIPELQCKCTHFEKIMFMQCITYGIHKSNKLYSIIIFFGINKKLVSGLGYRICNYL
jgi:hypothetical protein